MKTIPLNPDIIEDEKEKAAMKHLKYVCDVIENTILEPVYLELSCLVEELKTKNF